MISASHITKSFCCVNRDVTKPSLDYTSVLPLFLKGARVFRRAEKRSMCVPIRKQDNQGAMIYARFIPGEKIEI